MTLPQAEDAIRSCTDVIRIVNDRLSLSAFERLRNVLPCGPEVNYIIRDRRMHTHTEKAERTFEMRSAETGLVFGKYDLVEMKNLTHLSSAKRMYEFISERVNVRITVPKVSVRGNFLAVDDSFMLVGSSSMEDELMRSGNGRRIDFDATVTSCVDKRQIKTNNAKFDQLWYSSEYTSDYKQEILALLSDIYEQRSPKSLYFYTLKELFGDSLDNGIEHFERDNIRFKQTQIWNALYDFQKDAVVSAIQKISKYNGCIIADSVGLGKTFEALAVIRYFELRQDNVLVLTPAKLFDNWNAFRNPYKDNVVSDIFNYKILCHTDLSRTHGTSRSGIDLARVNWGSFDLVVIDESHNFRNREEREDGFTRYQRLLEDCLKTNCNTKVLLLSATPVNNSLADLKNQITLITADRDDAFVNDGIDSISHILNRTQAMITAWYKNKDRDKRSLVETLPSQFFKLLDMVTIARSRRQITAGYRSDAAHIGTFPEKLRPITYSPDIDVAGELLIFGETNEVLEQLKLAIYHPMKYIRSEYRDYYNKKFQTVYGGKVIFNHEQRENSATVLHRFNLFKRLESSVYAFAATIDRLEQKICKAIEQITNVATSCDFDSADDEEQAFLDYKYEIDVRHLRQDDFLTDLRYDLHIIESIRAQATKVLNDGRDAKLEKLVSVIKDKIEHTPVNACNRKVLVFTAFADTAGYLYENLVKNLPDETRIGLVTGSGKPKASNGVRQEYTSILRAFAPIAKSATDLDPKEELDVLIGTDCISEGQNLQDCDYVINYDIQWNPVTLIQRFGRVDRIGSPNAKIQMINFFPNMDLNEYLGLEQRVRSKMVTANVAGTGDENLLAPELNDISFRKAQLERLRDEAVDIDESTDGITLTDLNMNDYTYELISYLETHPEINSLPHGVYSVAGGGKPGAMFCFKHMEETEDVRTDSALYPYYLIYVGDSGEIIHGSIDTRGALRAFRKLTIGQDEVDKALGDEFIGKTENLQDMTHYSELLTVAVNSVIGSKRKLAQASIFDFSGFAPSVDTMDGDYELVSFLAVLS